MIALTRQGLPSVRKDISENHAGYGAYILSPAEDERQVTLIASGSEVELAMRAKELLAGGRDLCTAVVSIPCWELFAQSLRVTGTKSWAGQSARRDRSGPALRLGTLDRF